MYQPISPESQTVYLNSQQTDRETTYGNNKYKNTANSNKDEEMEEKLIIKTSA